MPLTYVVYYSFDIHFREIRIAKYIVICCLALTYPEESVPKEDVCCIFVKVIQDSGYTLLSNVKEHMSAKNARWIG